MLVTRQAEQTVLFARMYQERGMTINCYLQLKVAVLLSLGEGGEASVCEQGKVMAYALILSHSGAQHSFP